MANQDMNENLTALRHPAAAAVKKAEDSPCVCLLLKSEEVK